MFIVNDHANAKAFVVSFIEDKTKTTAATFYYEYGVSKGLIEFQARSFCTCMNNIGQCTIIKLIG